MDTDLFEELGFTKNETKVYLALNQLGTVTIGKLQKQTGLFAPRIYEALRSLMKKGLVSSIILNKRRNFAVAEKSRLKSLMEEKVNLASQLISQLPKISQYDTIDAIEVFIGKEGIKTIAEDELNAKNIYVLWGSPHYSENFTYYRPTFHIRRAKKKISMFAIFSEKNRSYGKEFSKLPQTNVKFLPFELPLTIIMYNDRLVINAWAKESIAIRIIDKSLAKNSIKEFQSFWKLSKK